MILADGKDDGLADFSADGIAQRIFKESFTKELVRGLGEKALFKFALLVGLLLVVATVVLELDDKPRLREKLGGHLAAGVHDGWIDKEAIFHTIQEGVAVGRLAVITAESPVGIEQQAALELARVLGRRLILVEFLEVIAGRGSQAELVADEIVEDCAGVAADGPVRFVRDHKVKVGGRKELLVFVVE